MQLHLAESSEELDGNEGVSDLEYLKRRTKSKAFEDEDIDNAEASNSDTNDRYWNAKIRWKSRIRSYSLTFNKRDGFDSKSITLLRADSWLVRVYLIARAHIGEIKLLQFKEAPSYWELMDCMSILKLPLAKGKTWQFKMQGGLNWLLYTS